MAHPFKISIETAVLNDLRNRLQNARWTNPIDNDKWEAGTNETYLKELCAYWANGFNWNKNEAYLNSFSHFKTSIDGTGIHFIHEKGKGANSMPLLLVHGFPDSFIRFLKVIPLLTAADENGFSFDVVVPSLPGYGFSDIPDKPGMNQQRMASLFTKLMKNELGYSEYMVHGGDWGSSITEQIALNDEQHVKGIHLTDVPWYHLFTIAPNELSAAEQKYLQAGQQWSQTEGAYAMIQSTRPQSLTYGLNDSPVGLAGWIIEKFYHWSDCNGRLENVFTKDELLTNLTIYWATQTIYSAINLYYEAGALLMQMSKSKDIKKVAVPTAVAQFPKDMIPAPRDFAARFFNIQQWTEMPAGGHFAAMEQPTLFANDIRQFAKEL
ncbi:epoxide hydrolase family protein [Niastella sp. OAS944]|uniref:epoxide hydrolase family protein n=1 Tax=Niastella sp. OAS944 TaxID=2664089 RepID=UPI0034878464|nr:pimeloyl-ACP methyl ester carboxylesterase [Chitinophagaceae bacterium OAS944]